MKTAISLPDELFARVDHTAKQLGMARSKLFARAVEEYIAHHEHKNLSERIDAVIEQEDPGLDPLLSRLQAQSIVSEANDEPW